MVGGANLLLATHGAGKEHSVKEENIADNLPTL